ncbi:dTDP-4-dehydrorhamnose reductase [Micromonospora yangpuensis]|uniref:dTDP-4-dehydrorhamnose reductase n=1 Tax=Micromonospora yangpuensis TaxID=683228 RepID=A0A1C6V3R4_9ACTN|nr:dTDP-4-dehydrorhamnose reductase [Micromonospora yangpuensis]
MRLYLTGADGMLGTALTTVLAEDPATAHWTVHGVSIRDFDIADAEAVRASIEAFAPDVVVHTAAHAIVDDCELDPKLALRVNIAGVRNVVDACLRRHSRLVYLSSDYVFDGRHTPVGGYREDDLPNPQSVYGLTKVAGERMVALLDDHLTVRTSWLFGGTDARLDQVLDIVEHARRGTPARLIDDQFSAPTYTVDLARALVFLLVESAVTGTVHVTNRGTASWHQVGAYLTDRIPGAPAPQRVPLREWGFLGGRPVDSTLNTDRLARLGWTLPTWQDAVDRCHLSLLRGDRR